MMGYERSYTKARAVFAILEVVGWLALFASLIAAVSGAQNGGFLSGYAGRETTNTMRWIAAAPGLIGAVVSLTAIAVAIIGKATINNAEITRTILNVAINQSSAGALINSSEGEPDIGDETDADGSRYSRVELDGVTMLDISELKKPTLFGQTIDEAFQYKNGLIFRIGDEFFIEQDPKNINHPSLQIAKIQADILMKNEGIVENPPAYQAPDKVITYKHRRILQYANKYFIKRADLHYAYDSLPGAQLSVDVEEESTSSGQV